jgi:hypothetical protein
VGVSNGGGMPQTPSQQQNALHQYLVGKALTPASQGAPGAQTGIAGGLGQLATALIANQQQKNWQKQYGIAAPTPPGTQASAAQGGSAPTGGTTADDSSE